MKPDADDPILSAYLDDELAPDPRRDVEEQLASDPGSAEHVVALGKVRELVADLPRPSAPCRLASSVLARVAIAESARSRRPVYWIATAASLVFAFVLADRSGLFPRGAPVAAPVVPLVAVQDEPAVPEPVGDDVASIPVEPAPAVAIVGPAEDRDREARARLEAMLDGPDLGQIVVSAGPDDDDPAGRVERLLRESARKDPDFVRMTVPPGLAIDPTHPEGGEVLVALMDDLERREFLARLGPGAVIERSADPRTAPVLTELTGLTLGSGPSAAGLKPPPPGTRVAIRHPETKDPTISKVVRPGVPFPGDPLAGAPVVEQADEPDEEFVGPPELPGARKARPRGPAPVVIWVARPAVDR
jgi:hypothetical protein